MKKGGGAQETTVIPIESITRRIFFIRGHKVILDSDLAELYEVETFNLNKAVNRNTSRFPEDFMFQLSEQEWDSLRFQTGMSNKGRGGRRYLPYAFTEHGVAMLASILRSERAVQMNIAIVRAFVRIRELLASNKELANRLEQLEGTLDKHASVINILVEEITNLKSLPPEEDSKEPIGFRDRRE